MKKADVQRSYHQGSRGEPMVNVKHHLWIPELMTKYRHEGHEFSGDVDFWTWVEETYDQSTDYGLSEFGMADEIAREVCWDSAQFLADDIFPQNVKVYSEGRQGGWLVVDGLPDVDEWDAIALGRWAKFEREIRQLANEEYPYQFIWHLHVNVWEPTVRDPQLDAERWIDRLAALIGA